MAVLSKFGIKTWQIILFCSGPLAIGVAVFFSMHPAICERWYAQGFYPMFLPVWGFLPSLSPIPVWQILAFVFIGIGVWLLVRRIVRFFRKSENPSASAWWIRLVGVCWRLSWVISLLVAIFLVSWGFNYQRQSWAENHGWHTLGGTPAQVETLARRLATEIARDRALLPENLSGISSAKSGNWTDKSVLDRVNAAWDLSATRDRLLIPHSIGAKPAIWPALLSQVFVAGIYVPFTGEAVVNTGPADYSIPFATAHEIAHQRGWAREDEANFLAFLVLSDSPDTDFRYAASANAYVYVDAIARVVLDTAAYGQIHSLLPAGFWRDVRANGQYWQDFHGIMSDLGLAINDNYLKAQGQTEGIRSYGRMVDLLLVWSLAQN